MSRHYERAGIVSIEEVFAHINENGVHNSRVFCGHSVGLSSYRIKNFQVNGVFCNHCGVEGIYFAVERADHRNAKENDWHLNLYALTYELHEILMTRDHVIPRSKGGSNLLDNSQTLCTHCNCKKADKLPDVAIEWINTTTDIGDSTREDNLARLCRIN
jgi:hypothetical protein